MLSLKVLRDRGEKRRFDRLRLDDARAGIARSTARGLEADLKSRIDGEVRNVGHGQAIYIPPHGFAIESETAQRRRDSPGTVTVDASFVRLYTKLTTAEHVIHVR